MRSWTNTHRSSCPPLRIAANEVPQPSMPRPDVDGASSGAFHDGSSLWSSKNQVLAFPGPSNGRSIATVATLAPKPSTAPRKPAPVEMAGYASFRREGEYWQIVYEGQRTSIRSLKGLFYLRYLLLHPEEKVHVSSLNARCEPFWSLPDDASRSPADRSMGERLIFSDAATILDARATSEYKARIVELRAELEQASRWADFARADALRREIDFLTSELAAAYGRNGSPRKLGDPTERLRKAVTNRIRDCITRLRKADERLGRHLANAIRTGFYCSYCPERRMSWTTEG